MSHPELEFFNTIGGKLEIELTIPTEPVADNLSNRAAPADSRLVKLKLHPELFIRETAQFRDLTQQELKSIAFRGSKITLRGESDATVTHQAPNGEYFTVAQLLEAVEETERRTRDQSEWFGGVDVHHCFFEGLTYESDGIWLIVWGS